MFKLKLWRVQKIFFEWLGDNYLIEFIQFYYISSYHYIRPDWLFCTFFEKFSIEPGFRCFAANRRKLSAVKKCNFNYLDSIFLKFFSIFTLTADENDCPFFRITKRLAFFWIKLTVARAVKLDKIICALAGLKSSFFYITQILNERLRSSKQVIK